MALTLVPYRSRRAFSPESQWLIPTFDLEGKRGRPLHGAAADAEGVRLYGISSTEEGLAGAGVGLCSVVEDRPDHGQVDVGQPSLVRSP